MKTVPYDESAFVSALQDAPYCFSLASSASASSASVCSDASSQSSQSSDDTTSTSITSDSDSCDSCCDTQRETRASHVWTKQQSQAQARIAQVVPVELRRNPRRTSSSSTSRTGCPPTLVRQADRKLNFVDNLVDSSTQIVEAIWPTSSVICRTEAGSSGVLPLRTFIQETLRRSRTSYSTLQVALYYLVLIKPHVPAHDFTMEQPDDCHASRVLQCGRRMFLAALILASKYLQDRNYSARAWSKISGLNTQEINQNEMAFLIAVNWKLHITEAVYNRWTDCVMKHTPSQPPSSGGAAQVLFDSQCKEFRNIILKLNPELDNLSEALPAHLSRPIPRAVSPTRYFLAAAQKRSGLFGYESNEATPIPKSFGTPTLMEPTPAAVHSPGLMAPAMGLLPTPRLTPQPSGFNTPAVSAVSYLLGKSSSMSFAMTHASIFNNSTMDRWPALSTSSPQSYYSTLQTRRSSLANSISTASSPESMVSDSSRTSRSSSISSASSLASAPYTKLDVQARCRSAKLCSERYSLRPTIASVPEDYEENFITSSPESYTGPMGKDIIDLSLDTPLAKRENEFDDATNDAARALQELHDNWQRSWTRRQPSPTSAPKAGSKRSRPVSIDNGLQDNVRELLRGRSGSSRAWPDTMLCSYPAPDQFRVSASPVVQDGRKRVCCSTEAGLRYHDALSLHPYLGGIGGGPGMWGGILN